MISGAWFDWADWHRGPASKLWPDLNQAAGVVFHSAVGTLQGVIDVVMGPLEKSVTGVVGYDGKLIQFYPVTASPWANGSHEANKLYLGFEFEGGLVGNESEPLTPLQVDAAEHILRDLAEWKGVPLSFWQRPSTLIEHNELIATACPSGRIPWDELLARLTPPPPSAPYMVERRWVEMNILSDGSSYPVEWIAKATPPPGA